MAARPPARQAGAIAPKARFWADILRANTEELIDESFFSFFLDQSWSTDSDLES